MEGKNHGTEKRAGDRKASKNRPEQKRTGDVEDEVRHVVAEGIRPHSRHSTQKELFVIGQ